jgi:hypothetical protein
LVSSDGRKRVKVGGFRVAVGPLLLTGLLVGCGSGGGDAAPTLDTSTTQRPPTGLLAASPEVLALVEAVAALDVPIGDGETPVTAPAAGFDCDALAEQFAATAGQPVALLTSAAANGDDAAFQLVSAAQINVADGIAACTAGELDAAAAFFAGARAAAAALEGDG